MSAAYYLSKAGIPSTLIEKAPRLGGVIRTDVVDGCVIEAGPDSFLAAKPWALELIRDLGLAGQVIGSNDSRRVTYVLRDGRLIPLPDGLMLMAPTRLWPVVTTRLLSWPSKIRMGLEWFRRPSNPDHDRSVAEFIGEHYGSEAVEYLAEPLLAGVYGGDPDRLSASAVLPRFVEMESRYGSLTRGALAARRHASGGGGAPLFQTLKGGLQTLIDTLVERVQCPVERGEVDAIEKTDGGWRLSVGGSWIEARHVVLACPAHCVARILESVDQELSGLLSDIPYNSSMTVAVGYDRRDVRRPLKGFGFLVPAKERRRLMACTFVNTKFDHRAPEGQLLCRFFIGGSAAEKALADSDDSILDDVRKEVADLMGIDASPLFARISRWPRSMAQYTVGHEARVREIDSRLGSHPGLHLAGNAYYGIGIPDCVRMGKQAAEKIRRSTDEPDGNAGI